MSSFATLSGEAEYGNVKVVVFFNVFDNSLIRYILADSERFRLFIVRHLWLDVATGCSGFAGYRHHLRVIFTYFAKTQPQFTRELLSTLREDNSSHRPLGFLP